MAVAAAAVPIDFMTPLELQHQALQRACLNRADAMDFLKRWSDYVHAIDDIEDEETTPEFRLQTFILALELYTHPFFLQHAAALKQVVYSATNLYADAVAWEKSKVEWQRGFADWARHSGAEMVLAVAGIVGGYAHMRSISPELRTVNWSEHHGEDGAPH